jgi:hypothetical protein
MFTGSLSHLTGPQPGLEVKEGAEAVQQSIRKLFYFKRQKLIIDHVVVLSMFYHPLQTNHQTWHQLYTLFLGDRN